MLEAFKLAVKYMTPVIVLSDGYLANSSEPWLIPDVDALERNPVQFAKPIEVGEFQPYARDPQTLARPWAIPGTPGLEHRIGGLDEAGHHRQRLLRRREPRQDDRPAQGQDRRHRAPICRRSRSTAPRSGELLVVGWGGTQGLDHGGRRGGARRGHHGVAASTCAT